MCSKMNIFKDIILKKWLKAYVSSYIKKAYKKYYIILVKWNH